MKTFGPARLFAVAAAVSLSLFAAGAFAAEEAEATTNRPMLAAEKWDVVTIQQDGWE